MYTVEALTEHALGEHVDVTRRQIRIWTRDGLLPRPSRAATPGQGRAGVRYRYPEPAPSAAVWLGRHGRFAGDLATAKFWMRVEGFHHVELDVNAFLRDRAERIWWEVRQKLPGLPGIGEVASLPEDSRERLLDEIDERILRPYLEGGRLTDQVASEVTMGGAFLGIIPARYLEGGPADTGAEDDGRYRPYPDYLLREGEEAYIDAARRVVPSVASVANLVEIHRAASRGEIRDRQLRLAWRMAKDAAPGFELARAWGYEPLALAVEYLSVERIVLPWVLDTLAAFLSAIEEVVGDEEMLRQMEMPPSLVAKLRANVSATREAMGTALLPPG